ncbi:hypothetical protein ACLI4Z_10865 [Natrialbaceae archaeon A-arb3/5]
MDSETASRQSLLGIAGLASLCCVAPGAAAVSGGVAAGGLGAGIGQAVATVLALAIVGLVVRWRTDCTDCAT